MLYRYALFGLLLVALAPSVPARATTIYSEDFNAYADGTLPTGWQYLRGPGQMAVLQGRFAQSTTFYDNYSYYAYMPQVFGHAVYELTVNVSDAYNTMVYWRADITNVYTSFDSFELVFNTSPYLPPIGHTRLHMYVGGTMTTLGDVASAFGGLHALKIEDQDSRVIVWLDGAKLFDVAVGLPPAPGHLMLNPGDWGSGSWYDNLVVSTDSPTKSTTGSWGRIKSLFR